MDQAIKHTVRNRNGEREWLFAGRAIAQDDPPSTDATMYAHRWPRRMARWYDRRYDYPAHWTVAQIRAAVFSSGWVTNPEL